jgi:hypothetical protein
MNRCLWNTLTTDLGQLRIGSSTKSGLSGWASTKARVIGPVPAPTSTNTSPVPTSAHWTIIFASAGEDGVTDPMPPGARAKAIKKVDKSDT